MNDLEHALLDLIKTNGHQKNFGDQKGKCICLGRMRTCKNKDQYCLWNQNAVDVIDKKTEESFKTIPDLFKIRTQNFDRIEVHPYSLCDPLL